MALFKKFALGASAAALAALAPVAAVHAQQTTASLRGTISDASGNPVSGATVTIVDTRTNSASQAVTSAGGTFFESGLRPGGPYTVTVSAPGFDAQVTEGLFMRVGNPETFSTVLGAAATDVIVVRGTAVQSTLGLNAGVGTVFDSADLASQPSINRDIISSLLADPLVISNELSGRDRNNGVISIAGQPPRFNGFVIDGLAQQNDFGLDQGIFPTLRQPVSIEWIEETSVQAADYSVLSGGFTGGLVNVVTKSGSNEIDGGAYFYYRDESLSGDSAFGEDVNISDFTEEEYGAFVSGPIIQDKLFFFAGYEEFEATAPQNFNFRDVDPAIFEIIRQEVIDTYGYDPQSKTDTSVDELAERWRLRLDWNITDNHALAVSYTRSEDSLLTNVGTFDFPSTYYILSSEQDVYNAELNSDWTDNFSTTFRISRKEYVRGQDSLGEDSAAGVSFGAFILEDIEADDPYFAANGLDGAALIGDDERTFELGPDVFRHQNAFEDERTTFYGQADWVLGDHTITFGGQYDQYDLVNTFGQFSRGEFIFNSLEDLANQEPLTVNYINATTNDSNDTTAAWGYEQITLFAQDNWQATQKLNLNFGLRWDYYIQDDVPPTPLSVIDVADPTQLTDFQSVYGVSGVDNLDGLDLVQPRFGFTYDASDRLTLSGGVGIYSGGSPQVWASNNFTPATISSFFQVFGLSGVTGSEVPQELQDIIAAGVTPAFNPDGSEFENGNGLQNIDVFSPDFEVPNVLRASLRADYNLNLDRWGLGDNYQLSASILYGKQRETIIWRNLAFDRPEIEALTFTSPDGLRPVYPDLQRIPTEFGRIGVPDAFQVETQEGGDSIALAFQVAKQYDNGFGFNASYTYQDVEDLLEYTSSRAVSAYRGIIGPDRQNVEVGRSTQDIEHSFRVTLNYERDFFRDLTSQVQVFGRISSGVPFSYGYDVDSSSRGRATFGHMNGGSPRDGADVLYIPLENDPAVVFASPEDETAFNDLIAARGLEGFRGQLVPRNIDDSPWNQRWDLRFQQELPGIPGADRYFGDNRFKFVVDIENFLNLLNNDWGTVYSRTGSFGRADVVALGFAETDGNGDVLRDGDGDPIYVSAEDRGITCQAAGSCALVYDSVFDAEGFDDEFVNPNEDDSVWRVRLGVRYEF